MAKKKDAAAPTTIPPTIKKQAKSKRAIPLSHYREAVQQHFNCAPSDFLFAECWENGPCQILIGEEVYRVDSTRDITEHARWLLTDADGAREFPVEWASTVLEDVHRAKDFYLHLLFHISGNALQLAQLQTVLAITATVGAAGNDVETFWESLHQIDSFELYPAAILAVSQVQDLDCMIQDVEEYLTTEGEHYLNQTGNEVFETVVLNEAPINREPSTEELAREEYFYIYPVDPFAWDKEQIVTNWNE